MTLPMAGTVRNVSKNFHLIVRSGKASILQHEPLEFLQTNNKSKHTPAEKYRAEEAIQKGNPKGQ